MWIITKSGGFMSVVEYDPAHDMSPTSPFRALAKKKGTHVLIRARVPEHLEDLKRVVPGLITDDQRSADYRFRAVIKRSDWKKYLSMCADEIDYGSHFKEVVHTNQPKSVAEPFYRAMMSIWATLARLQPTAPYGDLRTKGKKGHEAILKSTHNQEQGTGLYGDPNNRHYYGY